MVRPRFDPERDFVTARSFPYAGRQFGTGDPFPKAGVPRQKLSSLYGARMINFADGTAAPAAPADPVTMTDTGGGWYLVNAPWLDQPEKLRGKAKSEARAAQLREAGEPLSHHGVTIAEGENGWWNVKADWAADAENVHGEDAARDRAAQLRAEGPPPDPRTSPTITPPAEEGGMFIVNAPWLDQAVEFADGTEAEAYRIKLREAGPPDGWQPAAPAE